jgi:hypothetical protein
MSQVVSRMYGSHEAATRAVAELKDYGFAHVNLVAGAGDGKAGNGVSDRSHDEIVAAIMKGHVLKADARVYAAGVARGGTLVSVRAPFGSAVQAMQVMNEFDPIDSGVPDPAYPGELWNDESPMSSLLHVPVLLDDSQTFSRFWNVRPLIDSHRSVSSCLGLPSLSKPSMAVSEVMGFPLLASNATHFSSLFHLPLLMRSRSSR